MTCREGIKTISDGKPVLFNDCDHAFSCNSFYNYCRADELGGIDGILLTFNSHSPKYSYVKFDTSGHVIGTVEKVVASNEAICGAYYFRNREIFDEAVSFYLEKCIYNEYFVSGVYNVMAEHGMNLKTFRTDKHISFGTPEEYEIACNIRLP